MKKQTLVFVALLCFIATLGLANGATLRSFADFFAPSIFDRSNYVNTTEVGAIVYDTSDDAFYGKDSQNTWKKLDNSGSGGGADMELLTTSTDTFQLPAAATFPNQIYVVKNTYSASFATQTVTSVEGQFDGDPSITSYGLFTFGEALTFVSNGTNWYLTNRTYPKSWIAYTPTFTGFGTVSSVEAFYRRDGDSLEITCKFTTGTTTAVEARTSLPSGLTSASTAKIPSIRQSGYPLIQNATSSSQVVPLIEPAVTYLTWGKQDNSSGGLTKQTGNGSFNPSLEFSFNARVPIDGWE